MQVEMGRSEATREMEEVVERIQSIVSTSNLDALLKEIVNKAPELVSGAGCTVYLIPELVPAFDGTLVRDGVAIDASKLDREFIVLAASNWAERSQDIGKAFYLKGEGLTGWIFEHGRPLQLRDQRDAKELHAYDPGLHWMDPYHSSTRWYRPDEPQPFLGVPLRGPRRVFGVIKVPAGVSRQPFPPWAKELFMSFAGVLATLIRSKVLEDLSQRISELFTISATADEEQWFGRILDIAARLVDGRDLGLYLLDESGEKIELRAAQGQYLKTMLGEGKCRPYKRGEGLTGWVFKTGKPLCIKDVKDYRPEVELTDEQLLEISDGTEINPEDRKIQWLDRDEEYVHSKDPAFLAVPVRAEDGSVVGVLRAPAVAADPRWGGDLFFNAEDVRVLQSFADSVALFLQSLRRKKLGDILSQLGSILDEEELFQFVVETTPRLVRARGCSILLMQHSRGDEPLVLRYTSSPWLKESTGQVRKMAYALGKGKTGFVAQTGLALVINYYGPGSVEAKRIEADRQRYLSSPRNLVDRLLDGDGATIGLIRVVGDPPQLAFHQEAFRAFVQASRLKEHVGLPSPFESLCETGSEQGAKSFLAVPIKDQHGKVLGVIRLPRTEEGGRFSDEDLAWLESIANRLTLSLRTLELLTTNQERSDKLEKLSSLIRTVVGQLWAEELDKRLETIVKAAASILDAEVCSLWQVKRPGYIQLVKSHGHKDQMDRAQDGSPIELPIVVGVGTGLTGYLAAGDRPLRLSGDQLRGHVAVKRTAPQPHIPSGQCFSLVGIPLKRELLLDDGRRTFETIGLLKAENKKDEDGSPNPLMEFTAEDESILAVIAETVVTILDSAQYMRELEVLQALGTEVTGLQSLDAALQMLVRRLREMLSLQYARICVQDPQRGQVEACEGELSEFAAPQRFPIMVQNETIGSLEVDRAGRRERQTLDRFVTQAAVAIHNAQLFEQAENRRRKLQRLAEISAGLIGLLDEKPLLDYIVKSAQDLVAAEDCSLFLVDEVRHSIDLKASSTLPTHLLDRRLARIGTGPGVGLPAYVAATGEILNYANSGHLNHPAWSGLFTQHIQHLPSQRSHSVLLVPLRRRGEVIGVLKAENKTGPNSQRGFQDDAELLTTLANQAVIAISNARLPAAVQGGALERQVDRLVALREIDSLIVSSDDLDVILRIILDKAWSHSRSKALTAMVALRLPEGQGWKLQACCGAEVDWDDALRANVAIREAMDGRRGQTEICPETRTFELAVPVRRGAEVRGVLAMRAVGEQDWLEEDLRWLEGLAGQVAIAVQNEDKKRHMDRLEQQKRAADQAVVTSGMASIFVHKTVNHVGTIPEDVARLREIVTATDPEAARLMDRISRSAEGMIKLTNDMLRPDFQRREVVDLDQLLRDATHEATIPDGIRVHPPQTCGGLRVHVPYLSMREVFTNIVENGVHAIQATGAGQGDIWIRCADLPDQNQVVVEFLDTGCGFSEQQRSQLFEPVWMQPDRRQRGLGFALWWAKTLITVWGGSIAAESSGPGQGALFRVWLPSPR